MTGLEVTGPDAGDDHARDELPGWLRPLRSSLSPVTGPRPAAGSARPAAVLIAIGGTPDGVGRRVLLTERAHTLRHHPGQLAFPGGAMDPGDRGVADTALREGHEETGIDPAGLQVLGALPAARVSVSGFDVHAVVAWWHTPSPVAVADPAEVAQVLLVDLDALTDPGRRVSVRHPLGYVGPAFWLGSPDGEDLLLWGLSAHLLDAVLDLAGWTREWDRDARVEIPERFLSDFRGRGAR